MSETGPTAYTVDAVLRKAADCKMAFDIVFWCPKCLKIPELDKSIPARCKTCDIPAILKIKDPKTNEINIDKENDFIESKRLEFAGELRKIIRG